MLDSFRNFTKSTFGKIVVFLFLGIMGLAFALLDVSGQRNGVGGQSATLATVGDYKITEAEVQQRLQMLLQSANAAGQPMTMEDLLQRGGYEYVLNQLIAVRAIQEFAENSGMLVDKRTIETAIANDPRFQGVDGKFSQAAFEATLQRDGKSLKDWRDDITTDHYIRWLLPDPQVRTPVADNLAAPYATLLLERRTGFATLIRPQDMDSGPEPDDKALAAFYNRNKTRYQVPERRIMRYAIVKGDAFKASAAATDADIAKAYAAAGTRFAATEKRTVRQIILPDQASANAAAGDIRGGKSVADAATARKVEASNFEGIEKAKLAADASPAVADAAFGAASEGVVGPVQTPFGWAVVKVEKIEKIPAKTLEQARAELATEVGTRNAATALATHRQSIEDAIGNGNTFDQVAGQAKLTAQRTPALIANGTDPDKPLTGDAKPDETTMLLAAAGFQFDPESPDPVVIPLDKEGGFAVVVVERIIPAAPRPFDTIRPQVTADYRLDQQMIKARKAATDLRAEVNKGTPLPQAIAKLGIRALPPKPFDFVRGDLKPNDSPQVRMAFSMAAKTAKMVESPERDGYYVVYVATITETNGKGNAAAMERARTEYLPKFGDEVTEQFVEGVKRHVVVKRNEANIAGMRARLGRPGAQ